MSTYDIEELRQAMAERADDAPDALGVLAAAHETAAKRRRRRRTFQAVGVAAALVAVAVVTPTALGALDDGGDGANPAASEPAADPFGVQLTLRANSRSHAMLVIAGTTTQRMEIRGNGGEPNGRPSASVVLHTPGAFDASKVLNGERVTVNGRVAYYAAGGEPVVPTDHPDLPDALRSAAAQMKTSPVLSWEAEPGRWITMEGFYSVTAEDMLWLAELIEIKTPALPTFPFQLGYLPADLVTQGTLTRNDSASLAFGRPSQPLAGNWGSLGMPDFNETLRIDANSLTPEVLPMYQSRLSALGPSTRLGTYDSWYTTEAARGGAPDEPDQPDSSGPPPSSRSLPTSATPGQGATLTVMTPNCHVQFSVADKNRIPRAELEKIALATDFKDCTDPSTWVRPIP